LPAGPCAVAYVPFAATLAATDVRRFRHKLSSLRTNHSLQPPDYRTTPATALDAVAYNFFAILPARHALRPASTDARTASVISTASCVPPNAVFINTPSGPNSLAGDEPDAVL